MKVTFSFCIISLTIFAMIGCGPSYVVFVDSITDPQSEPGGTYVLLPGNAGIRPSDLLYREYAAYVRRALTSQGLREVSIKEARLAVFVTYGIGDPQLIPYSYSVPIYGRTDAGTTYFDMRTYGSGGTSTTSGTATSGAKYGIVGSQTQSDVDVIYSRFVRLEAVDLVRFQRDSTVVTTWQTMITSAGSSGDLRRVFPVMVGAAAEYVGHNTQQQVRVDLSEDDPRVLAIKGNAQAKSKDPSTAPATRKPVDPRRQPRPE